MKVGEIASMRKPHACGSYKWEIVRVGTDVGIRCLRCGRRVLLEYSYFRRHLKCLTGPDEVDNVPKTDGG
ncbi:MAG: DUF951 domain-containing protein [Armatimonadota bacterium]